MRPSLLLLSCGLSLQLGLSLSGLPDRTRGILHPSRAWGTLAPVIGLSGQEQEQGRRPRPGTLNVSSARHYPRWTSSSPTTAAGTAAKQKPHAAVTEAPHGSNGSIVLPSGMVNYDNATFRTSCQWNETDCYATCNNHANRCPSAWSMFSKTGVLYSFDSWTTETQTNYISTQKTEVVSGYTYAFGTPTITSTSFFTDTWLGGKTVAISTIGPTPTCEMPTFNCTQASYCVPNDCIVYGGTVELLFWPGHDATSASGLPSRSHNQTVMATTPTAATATYKNMTMTSPYVYISFQTAYAMNNCGSTVGSSHHGAVISLKPDELYTIQAQDDYFVVTTTVAGQLKTTSFFESDTMNYGDLTGLPPGSAYEAMPVCVAVGCNIITPSSFHPQLVLPTQVRQLDPAWQTCGLNFRGLWDPPVALQPAEVVDPVTTPSAPLYSAPASPHSTISAPASQTSTMRTAEPGTSTSRDAGTLAPLASTSSRESEVPLPSSSSNTARLSSAGPLALSTSSRATPTAPEVSTSFSYQPVQTAEDPSNAATVIPSEASIIPAYSSSSIALHLSSATNAYEVLTAAQGSTTGSTAITSGDLVYPGPSANSDVPAQGHYSPISTASLAIMTMGGQTLTAVPVVKSNGGHTQVYSLASTTLSGGGPALITAGHSYSVMSGVIMQDDSTVSLTTAAASSTSTAQAVITVGTSYITAQAGSEGGIVRGTRTILPGSGIMIGSHTLSAASNGVVKDGTTITFSAQTSTIPTQASEALLPLSSEMATASKIPGSYIAWAIGSQIISAGGSAIATTGHSISAASSGVLLEDGTTVTFVSGSSKPSIQASNSLSGFLPMVTTASGARPTGQGSATSSAAAMGSAIVSSSGSSARKISLRILPFVPLLVVVGGLSIFKP